MADKSSFADMMTASPAALAKMRSARTDLNLDASPFLKTPGSTNGGASPATHANGVGAREGNGTPDVAATLAPAFSEMFVASPANLAKMRQAASPLSGNGVTPFNTPAAGVAPIASQAPAASFADMFGGSPADLVKMRNAREASAGRAAAGGGYGYAPSPSAYAPADPSRFDDMFAASPAHLSKMRSPLGASASASHHAHADPSRFDNMFAASPAHLSKMRAGASAAYDHASGALDQSSDRFVVVYDVVAEDEKDVREKILAICLEQTVELPAALVPEGTWIRDNVVGRLEKLEAGAGLAGSWRCHVSYHADTAGGEMTQLVNVIFGNTSMKEGVMVADVVMPRRVLADYPGPKFGVEGLRRLVGVPRGPMIMTALKPMGSSTAELARMAYEFAKGGIDIIKDDHGLADQPYSPYDERVRACAAAVARANAETGRRCVYAPCVCAPAHLVIPRAHAARDAGAGAVLMIPGITGLDTMRELAADPSFGLPIICHPAMLGAMLGGGSKNRVGGFSHEVLLGVLPRLAGADATIFPSFGGRFGFSLEECKALQRGATREMGAMPPIFPSPGGGMTLERVAAMNEAYGEDLMLLIGGSLMGHSPDLVANSKHFMKIAGRTDLYGPKEEIRGGGGAR